jgi:N6-adenosine-specific RNA methylase IME4/ParB-like chromosome segregation protein Spo0J
VSPPRAAFSTKVLALDCIKVPRRRRQTGNVENLAASIQELGLLNPVTLTRDLRLVAGYHRLQACRSLGWKTIPAQVLDLADIDAELAEIDENLMRNELTVLERARRLLRRKELYELKHPETRAFSPERQRGRRAAHPAEISSPGFASDAASRIGVTARTVQHDVQIAQKIDDAAQRLIETTPTADNKTDLLLLARMAPVEQRAVARRISRGSVKGVKDAVRVLRRQRQLRAIERYTPPAGKFGVIVVDPPWPYECRTDDVTHMGTIPYPSMSIDEIRALKLPADDNCAVWLWSTNAFLPDAFRVLEVWGLTHKTVLTWVKSRPGIGNWLRGQTEHCILAVRGRPVVRLKSQSTVLQAPATEHSKKPAAFYRLVEGLCASTARLELFARTKRPGWACSGAELGAPRPGRTTAKAG